MSEAKLTRDDIKSKLTEFQGSAEEKKESAMQQAIAAGAILLVLALLLAFLFGNKTGRNKSTVIEIRRNS